MYFLLIDLKEEHFVCFQINRLEIVLVPGGHVNSRLPCRSPSVLPTFESSLSPK